ncbi:hypothetical protein [Bacillus sp. SD088]|uniref:hypothetical protein n=1 Tax=Bacillus sp. SD088 TaxID=2782012 RepID=UPI001A97C54F|nr:hypothetical protein [Bacillus sp. SD088]MBO0995921.1 hypothetical protein [Bacillus sp. SD088]
MSSTEIQSKKEEKKDLLEKMEEKKEKFLEELSTFVKNWFEEETKWTIKDNADKVLVLGEGKAKQMKREIADLIDNRDSLISKYMTDEALWWHTNEDNVSYLSYDYKLLDKTDEQIKKLFGELGNIFIKYEIVKSFSSYDRSYTSTSNWKKEGFQSDIVAYASSVSYSEELLEINKEYVDLISQTQKVNSQINKLEDEEKKENVKEWWESL